MEREKVIELHEKAKREARLGEFIEYFARLVEQETLERALMECEAMRDDMVKIKCSNQQIYGASQAVETIRSLKLPTN